QSARAVIPTIITQILKSKDKIKLGSTFPTRDFNFVADTVNGFIKALESDHSIGEIINIGSNFEISIGDTVNLIAEIMGKKIEIESDDKRIRPEKSEVERLWASNEKAKQLIGWEPKFGGKEGFAKGLKETIDWFSDPSNLSIYKVDIYNI
ncbi:MAG: GDP-mannose 4,6-dehydratase, partial [Leptospiraceae bacterium]|nr:GDP-mannose 4,6-dehydratase [Leptospiraceae bacterium]